MIHALRELPGLATGFDRRAYVFHGAVTGEAIRRRLRAYIQYPGAGRHLSPFPGMIFIPVMCAFRVAVDEHNALESPWS
ncbi:hypothetical protein A6A29_30505 [Streptomyces sp. TSRI0281]|nr:hypothetical protein [Streptomyces sp. TSRI0281]OKI45898.1 hypothetical protein A6A29_30505 [Streptomyces sp. TSRI0281]